MSLRGLAVQRPHDRMLKPPSAPRGTDAGQGNWSIAERCRAGGGGLGGKAPEEGSPVSTREAKPPAAPRWPEQRRPSPRKVEGMKPKPAGGEAESGPQPAGQVKLLSALLEPRAAQGLGLTD